MYPIIRNILCTKIFTTRHLSTSTNLKKLIEINDDTDFLNKVMNSDNPVIVNFHAHWCDPCNILTPKLVELMKNHERIDLATVDVDAHAELAHTFEVKAVPAVVAVRNGFVVDKFIGLVDADMIDGMINKLDKKGS